MLLASRATTSRPETVQIIVLGNIAIDLAWRIGPGPVPGTLPRLGWRVQGPEPSDWQSRGRWSCCGAVRRRAAVGRTRLSHYGLLGGLLGLRRLLLFLATFFRGALGSRTLLLGCLRGHALERGWLVLLLEQRTLPL